MGGVVQALALMKPLVCDLLDQDVDVIVNAWKETFAVLDVFLTLAVGNALQQLAEQQAFTCG